MKNPTNTFLASLASADLLLILLCLPVKVKSFLLHTVLLKTNSNIFLIFGIGKRLLIYTYFNYISSYTLRMRP